MKKGMLSVIAAGALFCAPVFADDTTSTTGTSNATTVNPLPADSSNSTMGSNENTTTTQTIQLKTSDGKMISATVNAQDLMGVKDGDSVTVTGLPSMSSNPTTTPSGTMNQ